MADDCVFMLGGYGQVIGLAELADRIEKPMTPDGGEFDAIDLHLHELDPRSPVNGTRFAYCQGAGDHLIGGRDYAITVQGSEVRVQVGGMLFEAPRGLSIIPRHERFAESRALVAASLRAMLADHILGTQA